MRRCWLILWLAAAQAWAQPYEWDDVARVVAIGDIHGAYAELINVLTASGLVDEAERWAGGATHLVSVGDLVDRGPDSRQVMDLLRRLEDEAQQAGGRVHVLLGNHEVMNLTGDLRDVSNAEYAAFAAPGELPDEQGRTGVAGHRAAFAPEGEYGAWLLGKPVLIRIDRTLFTHGGLSAAVQGRSIAEINQATRADLQQSIANSTTEALDAEPPADQAPPAFPWLEQTGVLWHRGNARCHALLEAQDLQSTLAQLGSDRVVVGHTPTASRKIEARLNGRVIAIDTGMLTSVYRGEPRALEIAGDQLTAIDARGARTLVAQSPERDIALALEHGTLTMGEDATFEVHMGVGTWRGRFLKLGRKARQNALAAHALDRLLGLNLTPLLVARKADGQDGLLRYERAPLFDELARTESGRGRPNYCPVGSAYELLAAFDALIGIIRKPEHIAYERGTWEIRALDNTNAFGTRAKLPTYPQQPRLAPALAERLAALDEATLTEQLGHLIKRRQIDAVLKRRDLILEWPRMPSLPRLPSYQGAAR